MSDADRLKPANPEDLADALAFALRYSGRKRTHDAVEMMAAIVAKRLVVTEELEDEYPDAHPKQQQEVAQIVRESGSRFTRKRMLLGAGAVTGTALGAAALLPVLSLGPFWDTAPGTDVSGARAAATRPSRGRDRGAAQHRGVPAWRCQPKAWAATHCRRRRPSRNCPDRSRSKNSAADSGLS